MALRGTSRGPWITGAVCALAAMLLAVDAAGQRPAAPASDASANANRARAAELFKKSADAYRQGDFKHAIELLDEAYTLDPQPVLVYNRARAAEGLGNVDEAIAGYERFLADEPNAPDRGAIEQRLSTLRRQRDERAAMEKERHAQKEVVERPAPVPTPPPRSERPPEAPKKQNVLPYVAAGVGGAGLLTGAILGALALSKKDDAVAAPVQTEAMSLKGSADDLATAANVAFVFGGVLVVAGAVWWIVDHRSASRGTALGPKVPPMLTGTF
jgi:tetratricopeptide (TPR) repeat protein